MMPSPIAESPAREAASSQGDPAPAPVHSPLAQDSVIPTPLVAPTPESEAAPTSPQGYVPPPLLDSAAVGPGGFTDEVDELPQPQVIRDPSFVQPESTETEGYQPMLDPKAPGEEMVESPVEEAFAELPVEAATPVPELQVEAATAEPQVAPTVTDAPVEIAITERGDAVPEVVSVQPVTPTEPVGEAASYFDLPVQEEPILVPPVVEANTLVGGASAPIPQEQSRGLDSAGDVTPPHRMPTPQPSAPGASIYPIPVYDVHEVWGGAPRKDAEGQRSTISSMNGDASHRSRASSIRFVS